MSALGTVKDIRHAKRVATEAEDAIRARTFGRAVLRLEDAIALLTKAKAACEVEKERP